MKPDELRTQIGSARQRALAFFNSLFVPGKGFKNTVAQRPEHEFLYLNGTWACVLGLRLVGGDNWISEEKREQSILLLKKYRNADGLIYPAELLIERTNKSHHYLKLHCNNYAVGAALELDSSYDFSSKYLDRFLDADFLAHWLDRVSFQRPWEESNNIVNVAAHLALHADYGHAKGKERLWQMLEWHNRFQNPKTGGFDATPVSYKYLKQSLAGAVHNFHIHHYLKQPILYPQVINDHVLPFLVEGALSACMSIDFTELAVQTISHERRVGYSSSALVSHVNALLNAQNADGGWYESDRRTATSFEGRREISSSSSSYSTWFRLCSLGMFAITLLSEPQHSWRFRRTLGMGYASDNWPAGHELIFDTRIVEKLRSKYKIQRLKANLTNKTASVLRRFV